MNQTLSMNYALHNQKGQHLGFLLMAADDHASSCGACLIRALPESLELEKSELAQALIQLQKMGELQWCFSTQKTILTQTTKDTEVAHIQGEYLYFGQYSYQLIDIMGTI